MSDTLTLTPAPQTSPSVGQLVKCSRTGCRWTFKPGAGSVPDLKTLYREVRQGDVRKSHPLTVAEVLSRELCGHCVRLAAFKTYSTAGTLRLMERWAAENVSRREEALDRRAAFEERQKARNLALAIKCEDKHPINEILAEAAKRREKKGKHRRRSRAERRAFANTPRSNPEPQPDKPNKKNKKGAQQGGDGNRKGRR